MRQWLVTDFVGDMLKEYLPQIKAMAPKQNIKVVPAGAGVLTMKEDYKDSLRILLIVCCLVLLIACANIANLLMARGTARRAQTSVRLALGASRNRLIRQSLTESIVLSCLGGLAGMVDRLSRSQGHRHAGFPQRALTFPSTPRPLCPFLLSPLACRC